MIKKFLFLVCSTAIILSVSPLRTDAYVPPAEQILKPLQSSSRGTSSISVEFETIIRENAYGMEATIAADRLFVKKGVGFRLERYHFSGKETIVQQGRKALAILTNSDDSTVRVIDTVLPLLLFQSSGGDLLDVLNLLGVDTANSSLDRIGKEVSYTVGTRDKSKPGSRLWIERKRGVPLRFEGIVASEGKRLTLRAEYTDYLSLKKGFWFPGTIRIFKDDTLWIESTTKTTETNTALSESLFYIPEESGEGFPLINFITVKE